MACGSTCTAASWLIVRPPAAGEPAHGAHPAARLSLEAPADLAGRSAPGEVGHDTGPQNRVGIEGALLGTGAPTCGHAPRLPAPVAPVGARVALDPAPDHRRGLAEHPGDARLTTQTPAPHRPQPGPTRSKADDNPHPPPLNQENCLHPMTPPPPHPTHPHPTRKSPFKRYTLVTSLLCALLLGRTKCWRPSCLSASKLIICLLH